MSLIRFLLGFCIAVVLASFAVFNRHTAAFFWSPSHLPIEVPLYLIVLTFTAFGFVLGVLTLWINMARNRHIQRKQRKQIRTLEKELKIPSP